MLAGTANLNGYASWEDPVAGYASARVLCRSEISGGRAYTNQIDKGFGSFPIGRLPVRDSRFHDNISDGIPRLMAVFWFVKSDEFPGGIVPLISVTIPRDEKIYDSLQGMVIFPMEGMPWICASDRAMAKIEGYTNGQQEGEIAVLYGYTICRLAQMGNYRISGMIFPVPWHPMRGMKAQIVRFIPVPVYKSYCVMKINRL